MSKSTLMNDILGQGVNEQDVVSVVDPEQAAPAPAGAGFEQLLVLSFDPVPQVPWHDPHDVQLLSPPFTANKT